jgi:hypothetical protein
MARIGKNQIADLLEEESNMQYFIFNFFFFYLCKIDSKIK